MADLVGLLSGMSPIQEGFEAWGNGQFPLDVKSYVCDRVPPSDLITSVRCMLLKGDDVLVVRNPGRVHIMPGGRVEKGESLSETLRRELLEETGWTVSGTAQIGFVHFRHRNPKPEGYKYPHPDFFQMVYIGEASEHNPNARHKDDYEADAKFVPYLEVSGKGVAEGERLFLNAGIEFRRQGRLA